MASNASKECAVCNHDFNEEINCPRMLPCSHCLCSYCIDQLISRNTKSCPFCRKNFQAQSAKDFGINTNLLDIMKYVAELERAANSSNRRGGEATSLNKIREENEENSKKNLADCKKATTQMENALRTNTEQRDQIRNINRIINNQIVVKLKEIEAKNAEQIRYIEEKNGHLRIFLDGLAGSEKQIKETNAKLKAARNFTDAAPGIDKTEEFNRNFKKSLKVVQEFLSKEESTRQRIGKSAEETNGKITIIQDVLSTAEGGGQQDEIDLPPGMAAMASPVYNIMANILGDAPQHITVDDLRRMSGQVRQMLNLGRIFGFQDLPGRGRRYARITINQEDELLCLHHLKEEEESIPSDVRLIKFDDVMSLVDVSCRRTFLELGIGGGGRGRGGKGGGGGRGRSLGRILIRLFHNENLPRNFSILCTGEMGPSYANSNILRVEDKGDNECERVLLGDYENNNGRGGKAMVAGVDWEREGEREIYKREWVKGSVVGRKISSINGAEASQFQILTRDIPGIQLPPSFGIIESGLNVVTEAIKNHPNIRDINIVDCGIVLSR